VGSPRDQEMWTKKAKAENQAAHQVQQQRAPVCCDEALRHSSGMA
jgi:hypothetical protein